MLKAQPLGERTDRRLDALRQPLHREQRLMLLRFDAQSARRGLTKGEEPADFMAELRERAVIRQADLRHRIFVSAAQLRVNLARAGADERSEAARVERRSQELTTTQRAPTIMHIPGLSAGAAASRSLPAFPLLARRSRSWSPPRCRSRRCS